MHYEGKVWLKHYPEGVPPTLDYPEVSLDALLDNVAERFPDHTATIFFGARMSYRELNDHTTHFASALQRLGVNAGDRVAVCLPNCPQFPIAYFGTLRAGGVVVQVNPLMMDFELTEILKDAGAETIVVLDALMDRISRVWSNTPLKRAITTSLASYVPAWLSIPVKFKTRPKGKVSLPSDAAVHSFEDLIRGGGTPAPVSINPREDIAVLQYTGGTTGLPKAAMLTHFNLVANAYQCDAWIARLNEAEEIFLCVLPFFHSYGMTVGMNLGILKAATMLLTPQFDPREMAKLIAKYRATLFPGVPSMYSAVSYHAQRGKIDLSSIKACISGGAPLPREVADEFERVTGGRLVEGYGLTEASPVTHVNPIWGGEARPGSIGLPIPDTECRIVDLDTGTRDLPPGEIGELLIRGPQVMKGYWNRPEETSQTLRDGWLYTGDIAKMDDDGYFYVVDRKKDLIIVGGFNVYPREVEEVLYRHPKILEAAVVGEKHPLRGEIVKAYVVLRPGEEATEQEIIGFCREQLAPYKVPRQVTFVTELPKSGVGKILRRKLREGSEEAKQPSSSEA